MGPWSRALVSPMPVHKDIVEGEKHALMPCCSVCPDGNLLDAKAMLPSSPFNLFHLGHSSTPHAFLVSIVMNTIEHSCKLPMPQVIQFGPSVHTMFDSRCHGSPCGAARCWAGAASCSACTCTRNLFIAGYGNLKPGGFPKMGILKTSQNHRFQYIPYMVMICHDLGDTMDTSISEHLHQVYACLWQYEFEKQQFHWSIIISIAGFDNGTNGYIMIHMAHSYGFLWKFLGTPQFHWLIIIFPMKFAIW